MLGGRSRKGYNLLVALGGIPNNPTSIAGVVELPDKRGSKLLNL
tara:strand:+ start:78 stop:209 length:132 start_codon:yes stop_codon:yes gene_type:complete